MTETKTVGDAISDQILQMFAAFGRSNLVLCFHTPEDPNEDLGPPNQFHTLSTETVPLCAVGESDTPVERLDALRNLGCNPERCALAFYDQLEASDIGREPLEEHAIRIVHLRTPVFSPSIQLAVDHLGDALDPHASVAALCREPDALAQALYLDHRLGLGRLQDAATSCGLPAKVLRHFVTLLNRKYDGSADADCGQVFIERIGKLLTHELCSRRRTPTELRFILGPARGALTPLVHSVAGADTHEAVLMACYCDTAYRTTQFLEEHVVWEAVDPAWFSWARAAKLKKVAFPDHLKPSGTPNMRHDFQASRQLVSLHAFGCNFMIQVFGTLVTLIAEIPAKLVRKVGLRVYPEGALPANYSFAKSSIPSQYTARLREPLTEGRTLSLTLNEPETQD